MTNLVKRLRHAAKWASLSGEAADEIERLQACCHAHSPRCWSGGNYHEGFEEGFKAGQKAVIKAMREWQLKETIGSSYTNYFLSRLDAYAKDRGI